MPSASPVYWQGWNRLRATMGGKFHRLTISNAEYDAEKWATVLALAMLTQVGIGLVQLDRPRSQAAALCTFTIAAVVTLGLLAVRERPFDGAHPIRPDAIRTVLLALPPPS